MSLIHQLKGGRLINEINNISVDHTLQLINIMGGINTVVKNFLKKPGILLL